MKFFKKSHNSKKKNRKKLFYALELLPPDYLPPGCTDATAYVTTSVGKLDLTGYTICAELSKTSEALQYFGQSKTIILTNSNMWKLADALDPFVDNVTMALDISQDKALSEITNFFKDKTVTVMPKGAQGVIYKFGLYAEVVAPATFLGSAIAAGQTLGVRGLHVLASQPLLFVAVCSSGSLFFNGIGLLAGNNTIGNTSRAIGWGLNRPLAGVEVVLKHIPLKAFTAVTGIPAWLNFTKTQSDGSGISANDALKVAGEAKKRYGVRIGKWICKRLGIPMDELK